MKISQMFSAHLSFFEFDIQQISNLGFSRLKFIELVRNNHPFEDIMREAKIYFSFV